MSNPTQIIEAVKGFIQSIRQRIAGLIASVKEKIASLRAKL